MHLEAKGQFKLGDPEFLITGTADRIDVARDGGVLIYDYKTGVIPSVAQQKLFDRQLDLMALIAMSGGFRTRDGTALPEAEVAGVGYIGLGSKPEERVRSPDASELLRTRDQVAQLLAAYVNGEAGFTARAQMHKETDHSDYDHLARFGEWSVADQPLKIEVGR